MNAEKFLSSFGHIANSPGGVARLRDLLYHFAFAGELVEPSEGNAADLAETLAQAESPTGRLRRPALEPSAGYYTIPSHWRWVNIGLTGHDWGQMKPTEDFTYIDVSAIDNQRGIVADGAAIVSAANAPSRARKVVKKGTVIYSTVRPYLLNIAVIERDFDPAPIASTAFAILHPHNGVEAKFVYYFLRSPAFVAYVEGVQSGIAYPAISDQKFFAASFPLAPTEEQKRIVAKVDELMALCEQLEAQQQERERRFPVLSRTCHARFAEAPNPANLNRIFDETGTVSPTDLRKSILTLAVQGKLVPQDPSDESAETLLSKLAEERRHRIKVGSANLPKPLDPIEDHEKPFLLPASWDWARLGDIAGIKHGFAFNSESFTSKTTPFVLTTPGNFHEKGGFRDRGSRTKYFGGPVDPEFIFKAGDLIIPMTEQAPGLLGSPAFIPSDGKTYIHNQRLGKLTFYSELIAPEFVFWFFNCAFFRDALAKTCTGTTVRHTSPSRVLKVPFPVCPLFEQRRIVAKVEELMALVDHLEAQQQERDKLAEAFAKAGVASFTGTTTFEKAEKMKAPKTELISVVKIGKRPKPSADAPLTKLLNQHKGELPAKALWQQSGLAIDVFYQKLKSEIAQGWIAQPREAEVKIVEEVPTDGGTTAHRLHSELQQ